MDSLTQIVLGAAVGEAVLGKQLGNRAVLWGAIAGTIPDLDVIPGSFLDETASLAFHRGFTHSVVFALLAPLIFTPLVMKLYQSGLYRRKWYKWLQTLLALLIPAILSAVFLYQAIQMKYWAWIAAALCLWLSFALWQYMFQNYIKREIYVPEVSWTHWYLLFFLGFLTHTLLDCFTTYGTQLWLPFSDFRVSWDVVNVADPFYTLPFMICLITSMIYRRTANKRRVWNYAGLTISTVYLAIAIFNKTLIQNSFREILDMQDIVYNRIMTTPTIFNNILWYCLAEDEYGYYYTYISLLDDKDADYCLQYIARNESEINPIATSREVETLRWFSNGFFQVVKNTDNTWSWKDLRFGNFDFLCQGDGRFIFYFILEKSEKGVSMYQNRDRPEGSAELFRVFYQRILGNNVDMSE